MSNEELIKKLKNVARKKTLSEDVVLTKERTEYRNLVLTTHANIENLLSLLIAAHFTNKSFDTEALDNLDILLDQLDYGTKVRVVKAFGWSKDKKSRMLLDKIHKLGNYRNAVVHLRKRDPRRLSNEKNIEEIQSLHDELEDKLLLAIVGKDVRMLEPMQTAVVEYFTDSQKRRSDLIEKYSNKD